MQAATYRMHLPSVMLAFELNVDNWCWKVSLLFSPEDTVCMTSNKNDKFGLNVLRLTIEHFSTLKQSILNEPWPTVHDGDSGPCSHMASFLNDRALVCICR